MAHPVRVDLALSCDPPVQRLRHCVNWLEELMLSERSLATMAKQRLSIAICFAAAVLLNGCGSGSTDSTAGTLQPSGTSATVLPSGPAANLSGRVLSESGQGVSEVEVVAVDRTTNIQYETVSGPAGAYSLQLPPGVYDVGLLSSEPQTATCFYGPITASPGLLQDFALKSAAGRPADQVFGRIRLRPGTPAAHRRIALQPRSARLAPNQEPPVRVETTTDANGDFALSAGSSGDVGLDVELHEANGLLDEWVDIFKTDKACYVELSSDATPTENRLHCGEADASPETLVLGDPARPVTKFKASDNGTTGLLENGRIKAEDKNPNAKTDMRNLIGSGSWGTKFLKTFSLDGQNPPGDTWIKVDKSGWGWYDWNVDIHIKGGGDFYFTDEEGGSKGRYWLFFTPVPDDDGGSGLGPFGPVTHYVSYNSDKPDIVKIEVVPSNL